MVQSLLRLTQRALLRAIRNLQVIEQHWFPEPVSLVQAREVIRSTAYDMTEAPDEAYYECEYLHWINSTLSKSTSCDLNASRQIWFDLGCGQGRLTLPLARQFPKHV